MSRGAVCGSAARRSVAERGLPLIGMATKRWEESRAGEVDQAAVQELLVLQSEEECELPDPVKLTRGWRTWGLEPDTFALLHAKEYELMRWIQRVPGLLPFSLGVHYSLLPKVITPALALIVWLSSFPRGASLIIFVCANDCLNTAIKWAVQRPRPRWYCPIEANGLIDSCGAWEVDLSFPSAHTMFFAGLAACSAALYGIPHWISFAFGAGVGISRNYLSMHWPTDTMMGLALGGILGFVWGWADPYAFLLAKASPVLSLLAASGFTLGLLCLMVATRQLVPPVASTERTVWFANALQSLSAEEREATLASKQKQLKPRNLKSKVPMLVSVWAPLAMTGIYPYVLPHVGTLPQGTAVSRLVQAGVGVVGLGFIAALKTFVGDLGPLFAPPGSKRRKFAEGRKGQLKALTYVAICAWTFLLSQMVGERLLGLPWRS